MDFCAPPLGGGCSRFVAFGRERVHVRRGPFLGFSLELGLLAPPRGFPSEGVRVRGVFVLAVVVNLA